LAFDTFVDLSLSITRSLNYLDDMNLERLIMHYLREEIIDEAFCSKWYS